MCSYIHDNKNFIKNKNTDLMTDLLYNITILCNSFTHDAPHCSDLKAHIIASRDLLFQNTLSILFFSKKKCQQLETCSPFYVCVLGLQRLFQNAIRKYPRYSKRQETWDLLFRSSPHICAPMCAGADVKIPRTLWE